MQRSRLLVSVGLALLVASVARCGAFSGEDAEESLPAVADAGATDAVADATDVPPSDGGVAPYVQTGVACRAETLFCNVGESCCNDGSGATFCAANCAAADAGFIVLECGRASDCRRGFECCAFSNGGCGGGYLSGTQCVPAGTCQLCGDGGAGRLACDRTSLDGCPPGKTCSVGYQFTFYRTCAD